MSAPPHSAPQSSAARSAPGAVMIVLLALVPFALRFVSTLWLPGNYAAQSLYKVAQLLIAGGWRRNVEGKRGLAIWWPVDERRPDRTTILIAIGVALASGVTAAVTASWLAPRIGLDPAAIQERLSSRFSLTTSTMIPSVLLLSTVNAALEELHYRVWLDRALSACCGSTIGIGVSTALFSAIHLFIFFGIPNAGWIAMGGVFLGLVIGGTAWSLIARRPGGIHAAWLAHCLTDIVLLTWGLHWIGLLKF